MNTLYIMVGLPYSGKTTLRKELVKRLGFESVSIDEIMDSKDMWRDGHPTQTDWNEAYSLAYENIEKYLACGRSVVFDCANLPFHERENAREIASKLKAMSKVIYLDISKQKTLERRDKNMTTGERSHLNDSQMKKAFKLFEKPRQEESHIIYSEGDSLDSWVKDNF